MTASGIGAPEIACTAGAILARAMPTSVLVPLVTTSPAFRS